MDKVQLIKEKSVLYKKLLEDCPEETRIPELLELVPLFLVYSFSKGIRHLFKCCDDELICRLLTIMSVPDPHYNWDLKISEELRFYDGTEKDIRYFYVEKDEDFNVLEEKYEKIIEALHKKYLNHEYDNERFENFLLMEFLLPFYKNCALVFASTVIISAFFLEDYLTPRYCIPEQIPEKESDIYARLCRGSFR